jgi:hypothetical protein
MRRHWLRVLATAAAPLVALALPVTPVQADPGVVVFPGMQIIQGTNACTVGFVDPGSRVAYSAGHCRGDDAVLDQGRRLVGHLASFRDNTPNGATIDTNHQITDWETINLAPDVVVNNILPRGLALVSDPGVVPAACLPVCHFGVVTGESCGNIQAVYNGWFTMANGVVSQKGDSGGPVYFVTGDGRAAIIGMFNSTWGQFPAAVSWLNISQQAQQDVISAASADIGTMDAAPTP